MAYGNGIKKAVLIGLFMGVFIRPAACEINFGEIIVKFVSSQITTSFFDDFEKTASNLKDTVSSVIPVPDIKAVLQKVKIATTAYKAMKELGMPEDIDLKKYFAMLKKITSKAGDFKDMAKEIENLGANWDSIIKETPASQNMGSNKQSELLEKGGDTEGLGLAQDALSLREPTALVSGGSESLAVGVQPGLQLAQGDLSEGGGETGENSTGSILEMMGKFLQLIIDNSEFVGQVSDAVDVLDKVANADTVLKDQMTDYINEKGSELLDKYDIEEGDIEAATEILTGSGKDQGMENVKYLIQLLKDSGKTAQTLNQLVEIYDMAHGKKVKMSQEDAVKMVSKIVALVPDTAEAVESITFQ